VSPHQQHVALLFRRQPLTDERQHRGELREQQHPPPFVQKLGQQLHQPVELGRPHLRLLRRLQLQQPRIAARLAQLQQRVAGWLVGGRLAETTAPLTIRATAMVLKRPCRAAEGLRNAVTPGCSAASFSRRARSAPAPPNKLTTPPDPCGAGPRGGPRSACAHVDDPIWRQPTTASAGGWMSACPSTCSIWLGSRASGPPTIRVAAVPCSALGRQTQRPLPGSSIGHFAAMVRFR